MAEPSANGDDVPAPASPERLVRVTRSSVADAAYASIRTAIVSGVFAPGEQLVESRIAERIGVGRGSARDALRRLRGEGLVVASPNRRVFVRELTLGDVIDIYNVRIGVEGVAIRLCTRGNIETGALSRLIEEMREQAEARDVVGLSDREIAFHEEMCRQSGNLYLSSILRSIAGVIRLAFAAEYAAYADPMEVPDEHVTLIEAIESGDEEHALRALVDHIDIARSIETLRLRFPEAVTDPPLISVAGVASWPHAPARVRPGAAR
jgi:DNA-binding GntR family transcriptional regulator